MSSTTPISSLSNREDSSPLFSPISLTRLFQYDYYEEQEPLSPSVVRSRQKTPRKCSATPNSAEGLSFMSSRSKSDDSPADIGISSSLSKIRSLMEGNSTETQENLLPSHSNYSNRRHSESIISCGPICRICHDGDQDELFISPCLCSGSVALVHRSCLERWLTASSGEAKCEICNFTFPVISRQRSFFEYLTRRPLSSERTAAMADFLCLLLVTPLIIATIYFCTVGASQLQAVEKPSNLSNPTYREVSIKDTNNKNISRKFFRNFGIGNPNLQETQFSGLILLATVTSVIFFIWIALAFKYQRETWLIWRSRNREVLLPMTYEQIESTVNIE